MAYLDGDADSATADRLRSALGGDGQLEAEAGPMRRMETLLRETGDLRRAALPAVDLVASVMRSVQTGAVPVDDPEDGIVPDTLDPKLELALLHTGSAMIKALPEVNLLDGVLRGLAHMKARESETGIAATENDAALALLATRLEAVGADIREKTPKVDIVEPVMESVAQEQKALAQNVIPFRGRPRVLQDSGRSSSTGVWAFRAAAVVLFSVALAGGWFLYRSENGTARLAGLNGGGVKNAPDTGRNKDRMAAVKASPRMHLPKDDGRVKGYEELVRPAAPIPLTIDMKSDFASLALDKVIGAKRDALDQKDGAADKLSRWGNLTAEQARRLLEEGGLSASAMLGAIQALPAAEAANYLRAAVLKSPEDPYLRYLLARNLMTNTATREEARTQIAAMKDLGGDNALPYYMDASAKLSDGDINGALLAMDLGAGLETANPYGLETARNRSAALEAGGMAADVARFLSASNAGQAEYNDLMGLGQDLMAYGQEYEAVKDYETANSIYSAVQTLGTQVQQGASLTNERLAGFDLQMSALDAVARLADVLKTPEGLQFIEGSYNVLAGSLSTFMEYLVGMNGLFGNVTPNQAGNLGQQILTQGDLGLPVSTP
jgi:hypothetical protein